METEQLEAGFKTSEELAAYVKGLENTVALAQQKFDRLCETNCSLNNQVEFLQTVVLNLSKQNVRK